MSSEPSPQSNSTDPPAPSEGASVLDAGSSRPQRRPMLLLSVLVLVVAVVTFAVSGVLVTIFEHRQEAREPFVRLVEVTEVSTDPAPWGANWPHQFDSYRRTVDTEETEYGGSSAMPASKLEEHPWLRRLYAGYAFSLDYREARGHAYMLHDQELTKRVTERTQSGACLHCHASIIPTYRRMGLESQGQEATAAALGAEFNWPAVLEGFRLASTMDYATMHAQLLTTPDGTPSRQPDATADHAHPPTTTAAPVGHPGLDIGGQAHPVSCIDCHDPDSMQVRVTRPAFVQGIAALAESDQAIPHLRSISRWRDGKRTRAYDPNLDASRQEMRTFVCAQCHVEYYCATKETLFFPWSGGLRAEQMEATYEQHKYPDGTDFYDYLHGETGAPVYKAQHPEFELWNQGIHARSGVACADCHMPYERIGAMKVSSHWVRSPLLSINRSCQTCHNVPEAELRARVATIQDRTMSLQARAARAMTDMLDAIGAAQAAGGTPEQLAPIFDLQRKAMWRLDFISSENSKGFHADQEAARVLGESIDYSRQAQAAALQLRTTPAPESDRTVQPVQGVTPTDKAPPRP